MELYEYLKMQSSQQIPPLQQTPITKQAYQPDLFSGLGQVYSDRYTYSPQDSRLWIELFVIASSVNHDMTARLQYIRNVGARLIIDSVWGFKIQPVIDTTGATGWESMQQYEELGRNELTMYGKQITESLKELRRRFDKNMIV